jgi:hypothetical protein
MQSISYPLQIVTGDLALDYTPEQIIASEVLAILETRLGDRPFRQSYGSKQYILKALDLSNLLTSVSTALETNLELLGFSAISVELDSTLNELQTGLINLVIKYSLNNQELQTNYSINVKD